MKANAKIMIDTILTPGNIKCIYRHSRAYRTIGRWCAIRSAVVRDHTVYRCQPGATKIICGINSNAECQILTISTTGQTRALGCACITKANYGSDSNLLIVFYVQIMPDDLVMQLHRF